MQNSCNNSRDERDGLEYAGFWVRMAAYIIDSMIVFAGLWVVRLIFAGISMAGGGSITGTDILFHYSLKDIVLYVLKVLYFIAFTYLTGTTLGKKAMNLCVVAEDPEEKLSLLNVIYRETVGRFLCSLPVYIGYIVAGLDPQKRGFHDMLCDTRVVYLKKVKVWTVPQVKISMQNTVMPDGKVSKEHEIQDTRNDKVEKQEKSVYNGYHLVKDYPEKETKLKDCINETVSENGTEE